MSVGREEIRSLERKIVDGTVPRCPACGERIVVGKKQEGASGAVGFQYRCLNRDCALPPGHAYVPWHVVLLRALQKRAVQLTLAGISSITITGLLGVATGVIKWRSAEDAPSFGQGAEFITLRYYADANDFLKTKETGLFSYMAKAQDEIWFTGLAFHVTLSDGDLRKLILRKLEEGVSVKFLVYDPTSPNVPLVARRFGRDSEKNLLSDCETNLRYLAEIHEAARSKNLRKNIEVKLYREIPQSRLYIFDRADPTSYTYFIPHIGQYRSPELPGYLFRNDSIVKEYRQAVANLWESGEDAGVFTLEAWLGRPETKEWMAGRNVMPR